MGRGYRRKRRGGWIRNASLPLLAFTPLGCDVHYKSVLELHRADLVTPVGRVPVVLAREGNRYGHQSNQPNDLVVKYENLLVRVDLMPIRQNLLISSSSRLYRIEAVSDDAYYQRNGGVKQPISLQTTDIEVDPRYTARYKLDLPPPLALFYMFEEDGTMVMVDQSPKKIEMREDDMHVVYLPFLIDGESFAIDIEFSIVIESRRLLGVPGYP